MESKRTFTQDNLLIYIVPEYGKNSMIIKALKTVKDFSITVLFGREG